MNAIKENRPENIQIKSCKSIYSFRKCFAYFLFFASFCFAHVSRAQTATFSTTTALPVDLDLGAAYASCASPGTKSFSFTVSGVPTLNTTANQLSEVNIRLDATCGASLTTVQCWLKSPSGTCIQISNTMGTTTNYTNTPQNRLDYTFRNNVSCLNKYPDYSSFPSTVSCVSDANSRYGIFSTVGNIASGYNGENPNGTWTLYFSEGTASAPCVSLASLVFGDPTSSDQTANGDNCTGAITWNGTPICAMTNGKNPSNNMPGWDGATINGGFCQWNGANNNDVWIKFTPSTSNVCLAISGLIDNLQSIVVTDPNTDGDNNACTGANFGMYWNVVSCPRSGPDDVYAATTGTNRNQNHCFTAIPGQTYYLVVDGNGGAESAFYITGISGFCAASAPSVTGTSICSGTSTTLTLNSPSGTNDWFTASTGGTAFNTGDTYTTPNLTSDTTYYIESTNGGCTSSRTAVTVTVTPTPTITSIGADTSCSGIALSHTLVSSTPSTFTWLAVDNTSTTGESVSSQITSNINDNIINTTASVQQVLYTIIPTATTGSCLGAAQTFTATIYPLPSAIGTSTAVCSGSLIPAMNFTTTPASNVVVSWTNSNAAIGLAANGTGNIAGYTSPLVATQEVGTISVIATDTITGCISASAVAGTFTLNPTPLAPTSLGDSYCAGETINDLTVTSSVGVGSTIQWYNSTMAPLTTGTPFASGVSNTVEGTTTFFVTETSALNCESLPTQVDITVNPNPLVDTTNMVIDTASCDGTANGGLTNIVVTSGTAPFNYVWTNSVGATVSTSGSSPNLDPLIGYPTGSYTLTVTDNNTCSATQAAVISAFNQPATPVLNAATSDLLYCDGETVTSLNVTSVDPVLWYSNPGLTGAPIATGLSYTPTGVTTDTTFYLVANNGCVSLPLSVDIDFHAVPAVPTVNDATYCRGDVIANLVATSTTGWYADNMTTVPLFSGSPFNISGFTNTSTIWFADSIAYAGITCGSDTGSVTIIINNVPVLDITTNLVVDSASCGASSSDGSITGATVVSGTPGYIYTWSNSTGVVSTSATSADLLNQAADSYTLVVTDGNTPACSITSSAITINTHSNPANPVFAGSNNTVYCAGDAVTALQASISSGTLYWYSDSLLSMASQIGSGSPFTPTGISATDTIYVVANNNNCNSDTIPLIITFNNLPTISANSPSVCAGGQVTLSGTNASGNATTYVWDNGVTDGVAFTPTALGGSYVVEGTDNVTSCANTFTTTVTVNALPIIGANVGGSIPVCDGGQVTLSGTNTSPIPNPTTYVWDNGVADGVAFTPTAPGGVYIVTGTDLVTNCVNTFTTNVTVNDPPTIGATVGSTAAICAGGQVTLSGTNTSPIPNPTTYVWTGGVVDGVAFTPTGPGSYTVTGTDVVTTCSNTFTVSVTVNNLPTVSTGVTATIPCGSTNSVITGVTTNAATPVYTWNGPNVVADGNTASPTLGAVGQYTLTVLDNATGCSSFATLDITTDAVFAAFTPDVTSGFAPLTVNFTNQSTGASDYSWSFGDGNVSAVTNPSNVFTANGTYTVTLIAQSNLCSATATVTIVVNDNSMIIIPNIFSPNGDGLNDELIITSIGLKELNIDIFNRWGQKVYVIDRPDQNWDGKLVNGENASEGTYFYIVNASGFDNKTYQLQGPILLVK